MYASVNIVDHPYFAITSLNGIDSIPKLPAGNYQIKADLRKADEIIQDLTGTYLGAVVALKFVYGPEN
jgi:hypothetical protein